MGLLGAYKSGCKKASLEFKISAHYQIFGPGSRLESLSNELSGVEESANSYGALEKILYNLAYKKRETGIRLRIAKL